jgi:hypothetical protein
MIVFSSTHRCGHAMTALDQLRRHLVHEVFGRAIARDPELVAAVERFDGEVKFNGGSLLFTLPHLYRFTLNHFEALGHGPLDAALCDYKTFRRMLYRSDVNTELRQFGAMVVVEHAGDDHALNVYRLSQGIR